MEKKTVYQINELNMLNSLFSVYDNILGVANLDSLLVNRQIKSAQYRFPAQSNIVGMAFVLAGTCMLQIEDIPYSLSVNDFLLIPTWESIHLTSVSPGFKAKTILVDKTYMDECIHNKQILSFLNCLFIKQNLKTKLNAEDMHLLSANFDKLQEKINTSGHSYYHEVVSVHFMSYMLDVTHILKHKTESNPSNPSTRKEELFYKFLNLLLDNYKEQHEVAYYAEKLFITPQYLTHIIKELTGKTTNKWIDDTLVLEARKLLKTTQTTVQQIADLLNFSDQSSFGKFFKKYHGVSPAEYRKLYYTPLSVA
ncbi:MAG: AraC family transcriptional regulator [Tannerellaceae bacterium]|jgi:AraC-like DNA-binding protein|nr:AraC family transcriptional regulator [Tannerellaceae bacterium]